MLFKKILISVGFVLTSFGIFGIVDSTIQDLPMYFINSFLMTILTILFVSIFLMTSDQ